MSKRSKNKKKFTTLEVEFVEEDTMLPTKAVAIERRQYGARDNNRSYGSSNRDDTSNSRPFEGRWRSGNNSSPPQPQTPSSNFGSFRNRERPNNNFSNDNSENKPNESDNNTNWRTSTKKVQPNISTSLQSNPSNRNANAWRNNNSGSSTNTPRSFRNNNSDASSFRNRDSSDPPSFRNRDNNNNGGSFRNREANSSFSSMGRSGGGSRFGGGGGASGGGGGFGAAANSKFAKNATSGGFGASVMSTIDTGKARLSYTTAPARSAGGRFARNGNNDSPASKAPAKVSSNRFERSTTKDEYPQLKTEKPKPLSPINNKSRLSNRANLANKPINASKLRSNTANKSNTASKSQSPAPKKLSNGNNNKIKNKNNNNKQSKNNKQTPKTNTNNTSANAKPNNAKKDNNNKKAPKKKNDSKKSGNSDKIDKKTRKNLSKKWAKNYIHGSKSVPINADTDTLLICGLDQPTLLNTGDNFEKIAKVLSHLICDKNNKYTLDFIFDILFNKTTLTNENSGVSPKKYLSLILELLSNIEGETSCLSLLTMYVGDEIEEKYMRKLQGLKTKKTQKEFSEYGLEYIYPLEPPKEPRTWTDLTQILTEFRKLSNDNQLLIYSNHHTMFDIFTWILDNYFFKKWSDDGNDISDEKDENSQNDNLAKELCFSLEDGALQEIVKLLVYKEEKDEDDDDEEDDSHFQNTQNSNFIVMLSCVVSISCGYDCWKDGALLCLLKQMHNCNMFMTEHLLAFQLDADEKFTKNRLNALSKLTDWIAALDEMKARLDAERDKEKELDSDADDHGNDYIGASLLSKPKHKSAADYETISYVAID